MDGTYLSPLYARLSRSAGKPAVSCPFSHPRMSISRRPPPSSKRLFETDTDVFWPSPCPSTSLCLSLPRMGHRASSVAARCLSGTFPSTASAFHQTRIVPDPQLVPSRLLVFWSRVTLLYTTHPLASLLDVSSQNCHADHPSSRVHRRTLRYGRLGPIYERPFLIDRARHRYAV